MTRGGVIELLKFYGFTQRNEYTWSNYESKYPYIYVGKSMVIVQFKDTRVNEGFNIKFQIPMSFLTTESLIKLVEDIIEGKYK